ncbi:MULTISPECIES: hypothetical protein [unclassified Rhizobium]|uniref:hypothetical protein n=1 Tax=unclassified Rhizobium TaxID=2613769 RepID=UPI00160A9C04|nr:MULTISPECIES: hypothetical protein [unclassified Rhizobium]MBB3290399.1 hypothetical protein [Rhizobium sp. BK252]MBB3405283.1 hypothetical protein [Rhizobium sp. BK289]MBB3417726.1 hypothetical protein [Rhizobium sp. BK284]MBB3485605.1 hypothetical protein [Rhizobium sp. BK347]
MRSISAGIIVLTSLLCGISGPSLAATAQKKTPIKITKAYKRATAQEQSAGIQLIQGNKVDITQSDLDINGLVKSERWFGGAKAPKDTLFLIRKKNLDQPFLCIMMRLEDESSQYAGCLPVDEKYLLKEASPGFPFVLTKLNGKAKTYKFNGNVYE